MDLLCEWQMLKSIGLNDDNMFYWDGDDRPQFLPIVSQIFQHANIDRCHSASWQMLCMVVIDMLNRGRFLFLGELGATWGLLTLNKIMRNLVQYYNNERTLFSGILPAIPQGIESMYFKNLDKKQEALSEAYASALRNNRLASVKVPANNYLKQLNSCVFNLRYPAKPAYCWNQSVGGAYDPRRWCYVDENGTVLSDEKNSNKSVSCINYSPVFGKIGMCQKGYYLLSEFDGYLLFQLHDQFIASLLEDVYLYFAHGLLDGHRVMASSSNEFMNTQRWESGGDVFIYYLYNNQWFPA